MQLNRILRDKASCRRCLDFKGGYQALGIIGTGIAGCRSSQQQRASLLNLNQHIDHFVSQHLKISESLAILHTLLGVIHCRIQQCFHGTNGFGASGNDRRQIRVLENIPRDFTLGNKRVLF